MTISDIFTLIDLNQWKSRQWGSQAVLKTVALRRWGFESLLFRHLYCIKLNEVKETEMKEQISDLKKIRTISEILGEILSLSSNETRTVIARIGTQRYEEMLYLLLI